MILVVALSALISPVIVGCYLLLSRWQSSKHHFGGLK